MRILAIDPGGTTGLVVLNDTRILWYGQRRLTLGAMYHVLQRMKPDQVVCEDFRIYPSHAATFTWARLFTVRLIGVIELYCEQTATPITLQMAATAKQFIAARNINIRGEHARSAAQHGLYFLYRHRKVATSVCYKIARTGVRPKNTGKKR